MKCECFVLKRAALIAALGELRISLLSNIHHYCTYIVNSQQYIYDCWFITKYYTFCNKYQQIKNSINIFENI